MRKLVLRLGLPLAAVMVLAGCATTSDPSSTRIRDRGTFAQTGLDARLSPLMRQQEVVADWQTDYCLDDPLTTHDWDCFASRNIAVHTTDLPVTAEEIDTELTRLGCHPEGDPTTMRLVTMLDNHKAATPHELPEVRFRCGEDTIYIQPSDRTDSDLSVLQRPTAWPQEATGGPDSRIMAGGVVPSEQAERLTHTDGTLLLVSAVRNYHSD